MSWLNPALLWFAALALVPVILHFLLRERVQKVAFSAVRFLRQQSREMLTRHRWLEWLLTALRVSCVLLLVVAFARPFLGGRHAVHRELIVLLDVSRSMSFGSRFAKAQEEAAKVIASARDADITIVTFADEASVSSFMQAQNAADALAAIKSARPGSAGTDILAAMERVVRRINERKGTGEVHLISDLQLSGISRGRDARRLPQGYSFYAHGVADSLNAAPDGVAIEGGAFSSDITPGENNLNVSARLLNRGKAREVDAQLFIGEQKLASRRVPLPQNGESTVVLSGTARQIGEYAGQIRVIGAPAALKEDDRFYFVARVVSKVRIAVVSGQGAAGAPESFFIVRALNAGKDTPFQAEACDKLPALDGYDAVVLSDVAALGAADIERLSAFVRRGGGLLAALGKPADAAVFNGSLGKLLPARLRAWNTSDQDRFLTASESKHPLLARLVSDGGDVTTAKFRGTWDLKDSQGAEVALRFNDTRPALVESHVGKGAVMFFATGLAGQTTDFPLRAIFVPFLQESLKRLLARSDEHNAMAIGETISVPSGASIRLPDGTEQRASGEALNCAISLPGIYQLSANGKTELFAANASAREGDLAAAEPAEIERMFVPVAASELRRTDSGVERVLAPAEELAAEHKHNIGWWCLIVLFGVLIMEQWLAGLASRK
ncbi:MAG TPA: BatA domain-containing protein [Planctomycetota bacterium]|jgi:hypothetical protein